MRGVTQVGNDPGQPLELKSSCSRQDANASPTWLEDLGVPILYRIHEKPEPRRVVQFEELAAASAIRLASAPCRQEIRHAWRSPRCPRPWPQPAPARGPGDIPVTPRMYQKLAARIEGKPEERILSYLMLRSLRQARYSEVNEGHFALPRPPTRTSPHPYAATPTSSCIASRKTLLREGVRGRRHDRRRSPQLSWTHPSEGEAAGPKVSHFETGIEKFPKRGCPIEAGRAPRFSSRAPRGLKNSKHPPIPRAELAQIGEETAQTERRAGRKPNARFASSGRKSASMQTRCGEGFAAFGASNPAKFGLSSKLTDSSLSGLR